MRSGPPGYLLLKMEEGRWTAYKRVDASTRGTMQGQLRRALRAYKTLQASLSDRPTTLPQKLLRQVPPSAFSTQLESLGLQRVHYVFCRT